MSRTALILAAHGSRHEPAANDTIRRMADTLTHRLYFDEIIAAFHQGDPTFAAVLDRIDADDVTIVPVMTSEGYYCDTFLPSELRKNRRYKMVRLHQTLPVGVHPDMVKLANLRAQELLVMYGLSAARTTLAIVGHGTPRYPQSRVATENLAHTLRATTDFADVVTAFLDEEPSVEQIAALSRNPDIVVIPFLIGLGPHAISDIPRRLGMTLASISEPPFLDRVGERRILCDRPIGADSRIIDTIIKLAAASLPFRRGGGRLIKEPDGGWGCECRKTLCLGTRASAMALWQAEHVASQLRVLGATLEIVEMSTLGDRIIDRAISDLPGDAPFTRDIEEALLGGRIDLAVHCLKDLPVQSARGLRLVAILKRDDVSEAFISWGRIPLKQLPAGAIVGTSSPRRAAQLLAIRPDLRTATIRGPVDDRVRQVRAGRFDAAILAVAGLRRLGLMDEITEALPLDDFLPAPGQGALAVQVRADDQATASLCSALDDAPTRLATTAELEFLRPYEHSQNPVAAAYAVAGRRIYLRTRVLSSDGRFVRDVRAIGTNPIDVAREAVERVQALTPMTIDRDRKAEHMTGAVI